MSAICHMTLALLSYGESECHVADMTPMLYDNIALPYDILRQALVEGGTCRSSSVSICRLRKQRWMNGMTTASIMGGYGERGSRRNGDGTSERRVGREFAVITTGDSRR